jgi:hypothetical protein
MYRERVLQEVANILHIPEVTTSTRGWIGSRTQAIQKIREQLTPEELEEVEKERKRLASEGNSEVHQRK